MDLSGLRAKARSLPLLPGVYIMRDKSKDVIYVGKAKALKNRVSSYFIANQDRHLEKVRQMVAHVDDFDYIICDSEFEALMLECSLIKQHLPKYNILLKDDKGYHYIHVSDDAWPRITAEKQPSKTGRDLGPYYSGFYVTEAVDEAKKIFKLPQCNKIFSDEKHSSRPCLNYSIGLCGAPCSGKMKKSAYMEAVNSALDFLQNGSADTMKRLAEQMQAAAENLEFERAAKLRDRITAIEKLSQKQKVVKSPYPSQDVIAMVSGKSHICFEVFKFRGSRLCDREHFFVDPSQDESELRGEFITRYYTMRQDVPPRIVIDGDVASEEVLLLWLSQQAGKKVSFIQPQRGEQKQLLTMCRMNAAERVAQKEGAGVRQTAALAELKKLTGLKNTPIYIEAYDNSNTAGTDNVAGMIAFENGKPLRSAYRKFIIKTVDGQDDYASMAEVLSRRLQEYEEHKESGEGFGRLPDLILLDGGLGQVSAVMSVMQRFNCDVPVFGMVKDSHHKTRALVTPDGEIAIKATRSVFTLISTIQDEVHRFAIGFHHNRNRKRNLANSLTQIPGIGKTRADALLRHFKSLKAVSEASVEDIAMCKGMNIISAQSVFDYYHNEKNS